MIRLEPHLPRPAIEIREGLRVTSDTSTSELVHRRELRPVVTTGAEIMDTIFSS